MGAKVQVNRQFFEAQRFLASFRVFIYLREIAEMSREIKFFIIANTAGREVDHSE